MRILIQSINYFPELTGIGKYTGEFAQWLSANNHEVRVITAPPYYPSWQLEAGYSSSRYAVEVIEEISVFRCPLWIPRRLSGLKRVLHLCSFAMSSFPVLMRNVFWRPDIIIAIEPPLFAAPGVLFVSKLSGAKSWLHIQDFEVDAAFDLGIVPTRLRTFVEFFEKLLLSKFTRVSTISEKMMERLETKGVLPEKRILFPNWVDTREIFPSNSVSQMRRTLDLSEESVVALYSGNMGEKQGLEIVIEAARRLKDDNVVFIMCGTGAAYKRLRDTAANLENIRWIPLQPSDRLNDLLNLADIHLLPQRADAADLVMPSKLTGMLASGRPVLATAFEGTQIAEVLKCSGKITPPGDVIAFSNALQELVVDKALRQNLGTEARRYAVERLDKEHILKCFGLSLTNLFVRVDNTEG